MAKTKKAEPTKEVVKKTTTKTTKTEKFSVQPLDLIGGIDASEQARESISTTLKLVISALTLVSALAWNDAIKAMFERLRSLFPEGQGQSAELIGLTMYALIVTLITVIAIGRLQRLKKRFDAEEAAEAAEVIESAKSKKGKKSKQSKKGKKK